jgi:hypothetical protein
MDEDFYTDDEDTKNGGSAERKAKKSKQLQKRRALNQFRESMNYFNNTGQNVQNNNNLRIPEPEAESKPKDVPVNA